MRTVTFKSVLYGALAGLGVEPDASTPSAAQIAKYTRFINMRVREACFHAFWPDWLLCEQREYRATWASGTTYALGAEVYYNSTYYTSLQAANTNKNPVTETTWWEETTDLEKYVDLDQAGETAIGTVRRVATRNPWSSTKPGILSFTMANDRVYVSDLAPAQVYVEFRKRPPEFTGAAYSAGTGYVIGDIVYYSTTGECYICIQAGTGKTPSSETAYWTKVDFPECWANFVMLAAYADGLRSDGQQGRTKNELLAEAYQHLYGARMAEKEQQGQMTTANVASY